MNYFVYFYCCWTTSCCSAWLTYLLLYHCCITHCCISHCYIIHCCISHWCTVVSLTVVSVAVVSVTVVSLAVVSLDVVSPIVVSLTVVSLSLAVASLPFVSACLFSPSMVSVTFVYFVLQQLHKVRQWIPAGLSKHFAISSADMKLWDILWATTYSAFFNNKKHILSSLTTKFTDIVNYTVLSRTAVNERHLCGLGAPGNRPKKMGVFSLSHLGYKWQHAWLIMIPLSFSEYLVLSCIISLVVTRHQKLDSSFDNPLMSVWDAKHTEQEPDLPF